MKLYKHQQNLVDKAMPILEREGVVLLAAEMRTGKTLSALSMAYRTNEWAKVLFVTKAKAIDSVASDVALMGEHGQHIDVTISSYDSLHKIDPKGWDILILDEVHRFSSVPKAGKRARAVHKIVTKSNDPPVILLSGTPAVETINTMFFTFRVTNRVWLGFKGKELGFYQWWSRYGERAPIYRAGGESSESYKVGDFERIMEIVSPYTVTLTQEEAGFTAKKEILTHSQANKAIQQAVTKILSTGVLKIGDRVISCSQPAERTQKAHMIAGGTLKDDNEECFTLPSEFDPFYRARYIKQRIDETKQYTIFTNYIHERTMLLQYFGSQATDDMEIFKSTGVPLFIGSITSWSEGVDLSWLTGALIIYSLSWSGATYLQIIDRMMNKKRVEPVKIHVMNLMGSIDALVFEAVSQKQNFNSTFYRKANKAWTISY